MPFPFSVTQDPAMKALRKLYVPVVALALAGTAASAYAASPAQMARTRIADIAAGKVSAVMAGYGADPVLEWVGGPLNGRYVGADKIRAVWAKFAKANPMLKDSISHVSVAANPAGATVSADVRFVGKATIPVRYVLTYRAGKLVDEVWQIDPKLGKAGGY
jgi:hypothetical protein